MFQRFAGKVTLRAWLAWIAARPTTVILVLMIPTILAAVGIPRMHFSVSVQDLIVDSLPERQRYDDFKDLFGGDAVVHVVVKGTDLFSAAFFQRLQTLSDTFEKMDGVDRVISLPQVKAAVDPRNEWSLSRFSEIIQPVAIFQRYLVSPDKKVAGLTLILHPETDQERITTAIEDLLVQGGWQKNGYQIGMPSVSVALAGYARHDFAHLPLCTLTIVALLLLLIFRSSLEMGLVLASVSAAAVWTLGGMAWSGVPLNMLTVVVPIFQIAVGTAYCLYIFCLFKTVRTSSPDALSALVETYARSTFPTLIAMGTTMAGVASLAVTPIQAVRQFSGFTCLALLALLVAIFTLLPCLMMLAWPNMRAHRPDLIEQLFSPARVARLVNWIVARRNRIFVALGCVALLALAGIWRIQVETNPLAHFKDSTPISHHFHDIYRHLSGSFPLHVVAKGAQEDHFGDLAAITRLADHQRFLETLPGVDKTVSLADYLMLVNYVTNGFEAAYYRLPEAQYEVRMLMNQMKSLLGRDLLHRYASEDLATANITMLTRLSTARAFMETTGRIETYFRKLGDEPMQCHVTGFGLVISLGSRLLVSGQVWSLLITLAVVFMLIHLMFLSPKIGLIALLANLFPVLISFGTMGWLGIELSMGTCLIASIVIGLAVDDTIHYLAHYRLAYRQELDPVAAMRTTLLQVGRPILATTIAISAGFSILTLSRFTPTAVFGLLTMLAMLTALAGGLIILPALLAEVSPLTLEEVFRIRIGGGRLQQRVPLLSGMSRLQIHRIFKTGEILRIDAGSRLFDQGDDADRMFVVISGVFDAVMMTADDACDQRAQPARRVNRLTVGDVIGEMGMMSSGQRCVSVVAVAPGDVLALGQRHLEYIRRLYPRTASHLFANLSAILTHKLIKADQSLSRSCKLDADTGLLNREAFLDCFEKEMLRARRFDESLAVCLLEIDSRDGHQGASALEKERLISQVSGVVGGCFRKIDILGRFGQTSLAVLLGRTTTASTGSITSRLKTALGCQFVWEERTRTRIFCRMVDLDCRTDGDTASHIRSAFSGAERYELYASP